MDQCRRQAAWATFTTDPFTTTGGNLLLTITGLTAGDMSTFLNDVRFNFVAEAVVITSLLLRAGVVQN